jgi:predicted neuraminidase
MWIFETWQGKVHLAQNNRDKIQSVHKSSGIEGVNIVAFCKEYLFDDDRPFKSCHASTLLHLRDESVLAAWFGGTAEKQDDVAIWASKRKDGVWSKPFCVADEENMPHWNPVLFQQRDGTIILYYKVGKHEHVWFTRYMRSKDGGETWSAQKELAPGDIGGRGPVKNKCLRLSDGTVLAPASIENASTWDAFVDISHDDGLSFQKSALVPCDHTPAMEDGVIQPALWQSGDGSVHMLLRSSWGYVVRSDSLDFGRTWCKGYNARLPSNNSGFDVAQLPNGTLGLIYNPVAENWGDRYPLVLSLSYDDGKTWPHTRVLEIKPGEYSYPAIIPVGTDTFEMTYTWKRERIVYCRCAVTEVNA